MCLAFKRQFIVIDGIAGFISLTVGAIGYFDPDKVEAMNELTWQIPIGLYFVFVSGRLVLSPYWVYKDEKDKADRLEKEIAELTTSKLQIGYKEREVDYYHKAYADTDNREVGSLSNEQIEDLSYDSHCISIENLSSKEYAQDVEVEITNLEPEDTHIRKILPIKLRFKDDKEKPFKLHQNINPDKTIFVNVIRMKVDGNQDSRFIEILTSDEKSRVGVHMNCGKRTCGMTIAISGKNTPLVSRKFKFGCIDTDEKIELWFKPTD